MTKQRELQTVNLRNLCIRWCVENFPNDKDSASKGLRMYNALLESRRMLDTLRNTLQYCPCCDNPVDDTITSFTDTVAVEALYKLWQWCKEKGVHEFDSSEVRHLLDHNQYANLNHLDRFAGIVYRPQDPKTGKSFKAKYYGINFERAKEFFENKRPAPVQIVANRLTGERTASTEKLLKDFPGMAEFMGDDGIYNPKHIVSGENAIQTKPLPTAEVLLDPHIA